ncbi:site-specific DNA-methyltransferase [Bacillus sp. COPE52]|uniref:site-specific DNA-methyltransferase n=1 Tax=Bacillus sp. COPE52 TaxID=2233998 RepID=UPI000E1056E9|nr:site-specific DNA-methyltransferase [Bacillus sp. COPE52]AXK17095.1 DNA methylase [Bacillus sp. COPE52]
MDKDTKQLSLLDEYTQVDNNPVICLSMTFENDQARREYFRNELRKLLPELKEIEGFPIGEDEDIIALSDPPYYTACPNPWINDLIKEWKGEKPDIYGTDEFEEYHREPLAADVSEGKNDPIYNVHSYHTKVPYKALMRYILHYTKPGDIIYDGFSGTGMTGLAAQMCNNPDILTSLGYKIQDNSIINDGEVFSQIGLRKTVLNDLSPIATFISKNFNSSFDLESFNSKAQTVLNELDRQCSWMYETNHVLDNQEQYDANGKKIKGRINFTIWSDVFICPECLGEMIFWYSGIDRENGKAKENIECNSCGCITTKRNLERSYHSIYDESTGEVISQAKQVPILINYSVGKGRYEKTVDNDDLELLDKIQKHQHNLWFPSYQLPNGYNTAQPIKSHGFTNIHHFYTKRNLIALSVLKSIIGLQKYESLEFLFTSMLQRATLMSRVHLKNFFFGGGGYNAGYLTGILYISSLPIETSIIKQVEDRIKGFLRGFKGINTNKENLVIGTGSMTNSQVSDNSVDYIFTDPPFGGNIMYSELNIICESWMKIFTNSTSEAIVNPVQNKAILEYQGLMYSCFKEYYRILKPGRWMTVEFSNSKASVWNAIQEAIQKAGFIIANVAALDKKQGSFKAVTSTTAVKQDLVISAYKPKKENIEKMKEEQNTEESAWTFVRQHLDQLPIFIGIKGEAQIISERTPRILFDRMVAYHVQNALPVPISSAEFQSGVVQRFPMRDGMAFLESQVAEYDKKRTLVKDFAQMSLFVSDENSAIEWIRQQLLKKPQTRQDLHPNYMKEIQHIAKHELLPELDDLLHQNFLRYEGDGGVPDQIASYLRRNYKDLRGLEANDTVLIEKAMNRWYVPDPNKQADLEKLREKSLLREFESYLEELENSKKKLKQFRTEAIRAGFKKAYSEKEFEQIVKVGDRLPEKIIQEDDKLLMYYDNACIRLGL